MHELTTTEAATLAELESVIETGLQTFAEVGNALMSIREGRLYRDSYKTFALYCNAKWGMSKTQANRLVQAAEITDRVTPIGVSPANEAQTRPLARLAPEQQPEAWKDANETAESEGRKVTAKDVENAVEKRKKEVPPKELHPVSDAEQYANMAIRQLQRMRADDPRREPELKRVGNWIAERISDL